MGREKSGACLDLSLHLHPLDLDQGMTNQLCKIIQ